MWGHGPRPRRRWPPLAHLSGRQADRPVSSSTHSTHKSRAQHAQGKCRHTHHKHASEGTRDRLVHPDNEAHADTLPHVHRNTHVQTRTLHIRRHQGQLGAQGGQRRPELCKSGAQRKAGTGRQQGGEAHVAHGQGGLRACVRACAHAQAVITLTELFLSCLSQLLLVLVCVCVRVRWLGMRGAWWTNIHTRTHMRTRHAARQGLGHGWCIGGGLPCPTNKEVCTGPESNQIQRAPRERPESAQKIQRATRSRERPVCTQTSSGMPNLHSEDARTSPHTQMHT